MDSTELTTEQCRQIHTSLFKLGNYLARLTKRMERTGFPLDDPLYLQTKKTYDEICRLSMDVHYLGCKSGVGKRPRE